MGRKAEINKAKRAFIRAADACNNANSVFWDLEAGDTAESKQMVVELAEAMANMHEFLVEAKKFEEANPEAAKILDSYRNKEIVINGIQVSPIPLAGVNE